MLNAGSTKEKTARSGLNSGLDVIELLASRPFISLTEIASALGKSKSGIHSVLTTLMERGYAERTPEGLFRLGMRVWEIGHSTSLVDIKRIAAPYLNRLAAEVNEAVILGVLTGFDVIYLDVVESSQTVRLHVEVGERIPANCTSTGISLLATLQDEVIRSLAPDVMAKPTIRTPADLDSLLAAVAQTRARGYAVASGIWHIEVAGLAIAVTDDNHSAIAGLCVSAPQYRVDEAWYARVIPALKRCSADMSAAFSGSARRAEVA